MVDGQMPLLSWVDPTHPPGVHMEVQLSEM